MTVAMTNTDIISPFRQRVFEAAKRVPRGRVTTYKLLAMAIGCRSSRAVGQALKANPFAPRVPCHRVIRSDLTIGGFAGHTDGEEITRKKSLLEKEGVAFAGVRLKDAKRLYRFDVSEPYPE